MDVINVWDHIFKDYIKRLSKTQSMISNIQWEHWEGQEAHASFMLPIVFQRELIQTDLLEKIHQSFTIQQQGGSFHILHSWSQVSVSKTKKEKKLTKKAPKKLEIILQKDHTSRDAKSLEASKLMAAAALDADMPFSKSSIQYEYFHPRQATNVIADFYSSFCSCL